MDEILQELIQPIKEYFPHILPTKENLYEYYLNCCRKNLLIVLCFSRVSLYNYFNLEEKIQR